MCKGPGVGMCSALWCGIEEVRSTRTVKLQGQWGSRWAGSSIGWVTRGLVGPSKEDFLLKETVYSEH